MRLGYTRIRKPPCGTRLDPTAPLARGLAACVPLWEGAGLPVEIVTGQRASSNSLAWSPTAVGVGLVGNGTSTSCLLPAVAASYAGPATFAAIAGPSSSGARQILLAGSGFVFEIGGSSAGDISLYTNSSGATASSPGGQADGRIHLFAATQSSTASGGVQFFRDGSAVGTSSLSTMPTVTAWATAIGANGAGSAAWLSGPIVLAAAWARALSASEHAALAADPWRIFAPWFDVAATVGRAPAFFPSAFGGLAMDTP